MAGDALDDLPRRFDAVQQRHRHVENGDVGLVLFGQPHRLAAVARFRDHLPVRPLLEQLAQPLPDDGVIIGEEDPHPPHISRAVQPAASRAVSPTGSVTTTRVPPSGRLSMVKRPGQRLRALAHAHQAEPARAPRHRRLPAPIRGRRPRPTSCTCPSRPRSDTAHDSAPLCRATLVSASCTIR